MLGFVPPPPTFFLILAGMMAVYLCAVEAVKRWFYRHVATSKREVPAIRLLRPEHESDAGERAVIENNL